MINVKSDLKNLIAAGEVSLCFKIEELTNKQTLKNKNIELQKRSQQLEGNPIKNKIIIYGFNI